MSPAELLDVAKLLADFEAGAPASDSRVRRAISTAYYAVFHAALAAAAERFMGGDAKGSSGYGLLYRGFEHRRMKDICEAVTRTTPRAKYRAALGRVKLHPNLYTFCNEFVGLQQLRHLADYDPQATFFQEDALAAVASAKQAVAALNTAPPNERADLLALLLVDARS